MFRLNKEEKKILSISHVKWVNIVYNSLPLVMLSAATTSSKIIEIETLDAVHAIYYAVMSAFIDGVFFEKKFYKTYKILLLSTALVALPVILSNQAQIQLLVIMMWLTTALVFNTRYGELHNEVRKAKLDIIYIFFGIACYAVFIFWNPLKDITLSYYAGAIIESILWLAVELKFLIKGNDFKKMLRSKLLDKDTIMILIRSFKRKSGTMLYESIVTMGSFLIIKNVKQDFALIVYIIIRKTPTFCISNSFVSQIKRVLINKVNNVNIRKLKTYMFWLVVIECSIFNLCVLGFNQKGFSHFDWTVVLVSFGIQFMTLWFNLKSDLYQLLLEKALMTNIVFILKLSLAIAVVIWRYFADSALESYVMQLIGYIILSFVYGRFIYCKGLSNPISTYTPSEK